jgi:UDP-N-acetyl-D-mannosaminuronic acid dehydrogenase
VKHDICVLGLGYIGLPTASIFASKHLNVLGVDVVPAVVETINRGQIHIEEPELDVLVRAAVQSGHLRVATAPQPADTFILAVPTPFNVAADGSRKPGLAYVEAAARSLASVVEPGNLVILESTSPVGTTELVKEWLADALRAAGRTVSADALLFAHCPERILPGQMLKELVGNDRIAGGLTPPAAARAKALYETFCTAEIFLTDARTAEMAKLTENAFRDVNIAFANELSLVCEHIGVDVWELIRLANRHPRVKILQPGPGVGGHCIAVDPWFIVDAAPAQSRLIRTAREVNDSKPPHVAAKVRAAAAELRAGGEPDASAVGLGNATVGLGANDARPVVVACLGLAFKADVDDLRESPAVEITRLLAGDPALRVLAVEPHARALPKALDPAKVALVPLEDALAQAEVLVLLVDHKIFKAVAPEKLVGKRVVDTRGIWPTA